MIVHCCQDLLFATRISSAAEQIGLPVRPARNVAMLTARLHRVDDGRGNDPVSLLFVDLSMAGVGRTLIQVAHQFRLQAYEQRLIERGLDRPDVPNMEDVTAWTFPIVAFGPHVDRQAMQQARGLGADIAWPRSAFVQQLPALLKDIQTQQTAAPTPGSGSSDASSENTASEGDLAS